MTVPRYSVQIWNGPLGWVERTTCATFGEATGYLGCLMTDKAMWTRPDEWKHVRIVDRREGKYLTFEFVPEENWSPAKGAASES